MRINTLKKLNCITSLLVLVTVAGCHQVPSTRTQAPV
ncbi:lipoprotein, PulS/OutS family, partial [Escherichia coli]|nr:lipoprotein, PulS/OutS family [Escherichia coli]